MDDRDVRQACRLVLVPDGCVVAEEAKGERVLHAAEGLRPDLAILEASYRDGTSGVAVARRLRMHSALALVFVADDVEHLLPAFDAGADDFIVRPVDMAELAARVRAVLRRSGRLNGGVWQVGALLVDEGAHEVLWEGVPIALTPLEFQLLAVLARTPGRVIGKAQLLTDVWSFDAYDPNLVEVHVSTLRKKLEEYAPRIIHTIRGVGYVLKVPATAVLATD